jgi:hypothetical protein
MVGIQLSFSRLPIAVIPDVPTAQGSGIQKASKGRLDSGFAPE